MADFPNPRQITAVLFDLDDTLIDWSKNLTDWPNITRHHINKVHDYLSARGHVLPDQSDFFDTYVTILVQSWDEAKQTWAGVYFADVLRRCFVTLGLDVSQIDFHEVMQAYDWGPMPGVVPYEDTIPVLEMLRQQKYKMGLITNSMFPMWMRDVELREYQLLEFFEVRITSGDTGFMKPHPAIYQKALDLLDAEARQAVFVGDRPANDIAGANETGLVSILIAPPHLERDLDDVCPDYTINCLSELLPILRGLESDG
jgi:HAD superfamily hydrolase (TIGR01549 family)